MSSFHATLKQLGCHSHFSKLSDEVYFSKEDMVFPLKCPMTIRAYKVFTQNVILSYFQHRPAHGTRNFHIYSIKKYQSIIMPEIKLQKIFI